MSRLTDVQRHALRFRIWQYAAPREWDVTIKEIAEALSEPWGSIRNVVVWAGWTNRLRVGVAASDYALGLGALGGGQRAAESFIVRDVLAGRVEAGAL